MKTCPKCNRTYPDEGQKFCTFDGGLLIAPQPFDPNATMRATSVDLNAASERPTSRELPDPNATMIDTSATVALPRNTGSMGNPTSAPTTADIANQAPPPSPEPPSYVPPPPPPAPPPSPTQAHVSEPLPPPPSGARPTSAPLNAPQGAVTSAPPPVAKKKSKAPLIIAGVLVFLLLSGGALAAVFFFVVKPKLDEMAAADQPRSENPPVVQPTAETTPVVEQPSPAPEDTFVPPPNTVQFENSNANLDGKLAEHYFDFSFYYPRSWQLDPKAGVPGAGNFVKVERRLAPESIQENFAVGWYLSNGTFASDLKDFPQRAEKVSEALAKAYPGYRKVSEGPTKVNSMDAYEFRWEGLSKAADDSDVNLWGRVVFLPTGKDGDTKGATIVMLSTSLAPELSSVEDLGEKGEAKVILDSFRFGKK
ncbi:MAG TPA: hypothetical protein VJT15_23240 [Pyrinomonadaceae bacterium]|nr:hypothetical protein [Pyrinomonadaceae bacterium]